MANPPPPDLIYQEDLRECQVVAIWAGDIDNEGELSEYLASPFEGDFGFLLDYDDLPEFTRVFSESRVHAQYNRPFIKTDVGELLRGFSWSNEWADEAVRLCRQKGLKSVKTVVAFPNLRYREDLCRNARAPLRFTANLRWPGGAKLWAELQRHRIVMPPFPKLKILHDTTQVACEGERTNLTLTSWTGIVRLGTWKGFASYAELSRDGWAPTKGCLPDGDFKLDVSVPGGSVDKPDEVVYGRPTPAQTRAFQHLLDDEAVIRDAVLEAIFKDYPVWRNSYFGEKWSEDGGKTWKSGWEAPDLYPPDVMPEIRQPEDLKRLIRLHTVHVLEKEIDGFVRVGFGLRCRWDEEHGLGVLTHKGKVIDVGQAETSFSEV